MLLSRATRWWRAQPATLKGVRLPESRLWTDDFSNLFKVLKR